MPKYRPVVVVRSPPASPIVGIPDSPASPSPPPVFPMPVRAAAAPSTSAAAAVAAAVAAAAAAVAADTGGAAAAPNSPLDLSKAGELRVSKNRQWKDASCEKARMRRQRQRMVIIFSYLSRFTERKGRE